jgi:hypothetical protein
MKLKTPDVGRFAWSMERMTLLRLAFFFLPRTALSRIFRKAMKKYYMSLLAKHQKITTPRTDGRSDLMQFET